MESGDDTLEIVDWEALYARDDGDESVIAGLAFRGRWTAIAAPAKAGKSTLLLGLAVVAAQGGLSVLYLDAEMGRADILDRVESWMHLQPGDLVNLHYCDLPPKLDTVQGSGRLELTVKALHPDLVVIDGLNGVVQGAENDDTTWRDLYEWVIAPMRALGIAVISADNLGKDTTRGPRGSSVKLDKADAVIEMTRTDAGAKLTATHRRSASYPAEQHYVIAYASEEGPPMIVGPVGGSDPEGTSELVAVLDQLDVPFEMGMRKVAKLLRENGHAARNATIYAAVKMRRDGVIHSVQGVPGGMPRREEAPGQRGVPAGVSIKDTPPGGDEKIEKLSPGLEEQF